MPEGTGGSQYAAGGWDILTDVGAVSLEGVIDERECPERSSSVQDEKGHRNWRMRSQEREISKSRLHQVLSREKVGQ